jgi:hypothetical protein
MGYDGFGDVKRDQTVKMTGSENGKSCTLQLFTYSLKYLYKLGIYTPAHTQDVVEWVTSDYICRPVEDMVPRFILQFLPSPQGFLSSGSPKPDLIGLFGWHGITGF